MESKIVYDVFHLVYWDWRVALDLFLGGLGVGAFIYAISVMIYKKDETLINVKIGSLLGPIAMSAGLLFLLTEMGKPIRIYKTLTRFNITSTMSWGGILQEGFILFSAIFVVLLFTRQKKTLLQGFGIFSGLFALFVACYHGFLLSFATARPLWNAGAVNVASILGSVNTGMAGVLLLTSFSKRGKKEILQMGSMLSNFLMISLLVQIITCIIWIITLRTGKADFVNAYNVLNQHFGYLFWIGAILIGLVFPLIILSICNGTGRRLHPALIYAVSILILLGGYIFRYVLVLGGQIS